MNPEETPFFRKELTGETHKAEGERVRVEGEEGSGEEEEEEETQAGVGVATGGDNPQRVALQHLNTPNSGL